MKNKTLKQLLINDFSVDNDFVSNNNGTFTHIIDDVTLIIEPLSTSIKCRINKVGTEKHEFILNELDIKKYNELIKINLNLKNLFMSKLVEYLIDNKLIKL